MRRLAVADLRHRHMGEGTIDLFSALTAQAHSEAPLWPGGAAVGFRPPGSRGNRYSFDHEYRRGLGHDRP